MRRIVVPEKRCLSEELAPGVLHQRFWPGGIDGPYGELGFPTPGGQGWSESFLLGSSDDAFQMLIPDIRLPANQYWPLHWHDCWTAVIVLEGQCLIGDWWMSPGDVFIAGPSIEYGPLVIRPKGARLFEVFAQAHLAPGGYAPEYRDHPTLQGANAVFFERSHLNTRNNGHQTLTSDGIDGFSKSRLVPGGRWDLGAQGDPERGIMSYNQLPPGTRRAADASDDWRAFIVMEGSLEANGRTLAKDDYLIVQPHARLPEIVASDKGVHFLAAARTARGI